MKWNWIRYEIVLSKNKAISNNQYNAFFNWQMREKSNRTLRDRDSNEWWGKITQ